MAQNIPANLQFVLAAVIEFFFEELRRIRRNRVLLLNVIRELCNPRRRVVRGPYLQNHAGTRLFIAILNGDDFMAKKHIRMTSRSFHSLCILCKPSKKSGWSLEMEVVTFLFWLGCGAAFRIVGAVFNMPRSSVHRVVIKTLNKIVSMRLHLISLPAEEDLEAVGASFAEMAKSAVFSQCVGAIDGCQIKILCPKGLQDQYINRKLRYSINMQAVVDHEGKFINVMAGFPGSCHDSRVLRHSSVFRQGLYPPRGYFIVGDSGYPCRKEPITIITPYKEPGVIPSVRAFNHALSRARIVVEQAFGMMKVRWRAIFTKDLEVKIPNAVCVIIACAVMHNVCITNGDRLDVQPEDVPHPPPPREAADEQDGSRHRDLMLTLFTAEQQQ